VALCVKNNEVTIEDAICSVLAQNFPKEFMEIIVVDGCSRDKTVSIVKKLLFGANIRTRIFSENKGLGEARQIVVDNAIGDYIVWVDGDMILTKDYVRKQVDFMERTPAAGIAKGRYGLGRRQTLVAYLQNIDYFAKAFSWWGSEYKEKLTSKPLGTSGSIYRVQSIRQVGGFDRRIKGGYEDTDVEQRIRATGWLIYATDTVFFEQYRDSWRALWNQYFWWGYGAHCVHHVNKAVFLPPFPRLYEMLPPAGFLAGLWRSIIAYKWVYQKAVFLLPFQYAFKRIAWCFGFAKSHTDGYGHQ
jgi:glycosyltransferase involved in cell wall biosynthesis